MQKITPRRTGFIRALAMLLMLVFAGQAHSASVMTCDMPEQSKAHHAFQMGMADMSYEAGMGDAAADCCADSGCEMAHCSVLFMPALAILDNLPSAELSPIYNEQLQSLPMALLLRPPIKL